MQTLPSDPSDFNLSNDPDAFSEQAPPDQLPSNPTEDRIDNETEAVKRSGTKLRTRLLQTLLPAVLLPLMIASFVGYRAIAQRSEASIQEQLKNQALLASEGTTAVLDDLLDLPRTVADSPLVINEARVGSREAEEAGLTDLSVEEIETQFADTKLLRSHDALNTYLRQTVETAEIAEILVTDSHGFNVAYSRPVADMVQSDEDWWQNGKANQQWIGPPDFDFASKGFTVELVQAILDPQNGDSFVGIIKATLPTRKFSLLANALKRTGITGSQRVQLVDGGRLSTIDTFSAQGFHKDRSIIGGEAVEQFTRNFVAATQAPQAASDIAIAQPERNAQRILSTLEGIRAQQTDIKAIALPVVDEDVVVASFIYEGRQYKIANIASSNWVAIASMDSREISAVGRDSLLFFSLLTLLLGAITTGLIFLLSRQLSGPISRLTEQAKVAADGNLNIEVEPTGTAETRFLTQTFNQLIAQVKDLVDSQSTETQKVQLFADITSAPISNRVEMTELLDRILPTARGILGVDRLAFFQIARAGSSSNSDGSNDRQRREVVLSGRVASESVALGLSAAERYPTGTAWLPIAALRSAADSATEEPPLLIFNSHDDLAIDPDHQAFMSRAQIKSSINVPVFYEVSMPSGQLKQVLWGYLMAHSQRDRLWDSADIRFLERLAVQLKRVLDRVSAVSSVQKSRQAVQRSQQQAEVVTRASRQQSESQRLHDEQLKQQVFALSEDISGVFQGDLTVRASVNQGDLRTIAEVFNTTVAKLEALVTQVKGSTTEIDDFLSQNEQSASQLAQLTSQQSRDAVETLAKIQAVAQSMDWVVVQAHDAAESAHHMGDRAQKGKTAIDQASIKIQTLSDISDNAIFQIDQLTRSSHNVSYMVEMIANISADMRKLASQTADNVAVWAAKGELEPAQQRALAQTTRDMDELAERSASEAVLIDTFLNSVGKTTQQMTAAIEQINQEVTHSAQTMQTSQESLGEVLTIAEQYEQLARTVSDAAQEQSQVSQTASGLLETIVGLSEQTSQFSQEIARSLQNTATTARELRSSVDFFKVKPQR